MEKPHALIFPFLFLYGLFLFPILDGGSIVNAQGTNDDSELWGYVEVRPKAHMFWWLYKSPNMICDPSKLWPIILWLQGGPGTSGVGVGNFLEIGPLDLYLKPRNSTWLNKADLLFVDNPVGSGYSYVEDKSLLVKTDEEAAADLTTLLIAVVNKNKYLQDRPLHIVGDTYGGKYAVTLGLSTLNSITAGKLKLKLGGIVLGDSWISPLDYVLSMGPLLKDMSMLDDSGLAAVNRVANKIKQQLMAGKLADAYNSGLEFGNEVIPYYSDGVNFANFLDEGTDILEPSTSAQSSQQVSSSRMMMKRYSSKNLGVLKGNLTRLMNEEIKKKLKIIPQNLIWAENSDPVVVQFENEFFTPRIIEVDKLLSNGVNVSIYNGQLDLFCSTMGTEAWVKKLKWSELKTFLGMNRTALYYKDDDRFTRGFTKSYKNLQFYWILGAGNYVPVEQPYMALDIIGNITQSPDVTNI